MFERFTDRARRCVTAAQERARELGHDSIGTEHILLGVLADPGSVASGVLRGMGLDAEGVRREVEEEVVDLRASDPVSGHIPFTPRAKRVLELSLREALALKHNHIGTEHILLGLLSEGEGIGAQVLTKLGVQLVEARAAVTEYLEGGKATGTEGMATVTTERTSTVRADGVEDFLAPTCPTCRAAVEETAASRILNVPQEGGDGHVRVAFVYCEACGATLTSRILDG